MDEIIIPPAIHSAVGGLTLLAALITTVLTWQGQRRGRQGTPQQAALIALQLLLMLQIAVGIKLLDQNMGVMQKYVHYLGGLGALAFLMLIYWLPRKDQAAPPARNAAWLTTASLVFIILSFFIGQAFVRGNLSA